ncbi:MAG: Uma2 family endonuclease [Bacteroidota bacterium]
MALPATRLYATIDDLVQREEETGVRHELYDGELFAMAGARLPHTILSTNLASELRDALNDMPCVALGPDGRVLCPATDESEPDLYTFPDVSVVCGEPQIVPPADTLTNPVLVAEVVSASTEAYDRGQKFALYRRIPTLHTYLLLAQDRRSVDVFERAGDGWSLRDGDDDTVRLRHLGVTLAMDAPLHPPRHEG